MNTKSAQIADDTAQIARFEQQKELHNVLLKVGDDEVEVTQRHFRCNSIVIPAQDIDGVFLRAFAGYINGIKSWWTVSYSIGIKSTSCKPLTVQCKGLLRSEKNAKADFNAIINALYHQIIPGLCSRLTNEIAAGKEVPLGDCLMTAKGIRIPTGLLRKEVHLIPWPDIRCRIEYFQGWLGFWRMESSQGYNGVLNIRSVQQPKLSKQISIGDVWNAVIFKEIANSMVTHLG